MYRSYLKVTKYSSVQLCIYWCWNLVTRKWREVKGFNIEEYNYFLGNKQANKKRLLITYLKLKCSS